MKPWGRPPRVAEKDGMSRTPDTLGSYVVPAILGIALPSVATAAYIAFATSRLNSLHSSLDVIILWAYLQLPLLALAGIGGVVMGIAARILQRFRTTPFPPRSRFGIAFALATTGGIAMVAFAYLSAYWLYPDDHPWIRNYWHMLGLLLVLLFGLLVSIVPIFMLMRAFSAIVWSLCAVNGFSLLRAALLFAAAPMLMAISVIPFGAPLEAVSAPPALPPRRQAAKRLFLVGMDGATFRVMNALMARGELPHIRAAMERGAHGLLETLVPTYSPPLWTTIATAVRPARHGVLHFMVQHPRGMSEPVRAFPEHLGLNSSFFLSNIYGRTMSKTYPVTAQSRRAATVWEIASAYGLKVGVVNWWPSWPAGRLNGFMVSDRVDTYVKLKSASTSPASRDGLTSPPALLNEVEAIAQERGWARDRRFSAENWMQLSLQLFRQYQPDLFLVYLPEPDRVQHFTWDAYEPHLFRSSAERVARHGSDIPDTYRSLDRLVGETLNTIGDEVTLMIVSDHGAGPYFCPFNRYKGAHSNGPPGVIIAAGPGVRKGVEIGRASILDVAPTILALLGLPTARTMEGSVLSEMLAPEITREMGAPVATWDHLVSHMQVAQDPHLGREEEERLRALGYIR